jgi:aminoglycoside 6'-N-acetyltransferase I
MQITDLTAHNPRHLGEAASLLVDGFAGTGATAWTTIEAARVEVEQSLADGRISRVAIDGAGAVLGWIGGISAYDGHAWELHPLVVRRDRQRQGIGRALVRDLEAEVRRRGGITIYLGADDESCRTSLGGVDVYPDVLGSLQRIRNVRDHPFPFYQKVGFVIVGAIPDSNGFGKPDILMAKRVGRGLANAETER